MVRARPKRRPPAQEPLFRRGETLEERYAGDPELLALYKKKLPKPGWAGVRDACEKEYIRRAKQVSAAQKAA